MSKTCDVNTDVNQENGYKSDEELTPLRAELSLFTENPTLGFSEMRFECLKKPSSLLKNALVDHRQRLSRCFRARLISWLVAAGGRRAAAWASFFGLWPL